MPRNLLKRGGTFAARYVVPRRYRSIIGRATIVKTTGTGDLREAERASHRILSDIHEGVLRAVANAESGRTPRSLLDDAVALHEQVAAGTIDSETAMALLTDKLEQHHALLGGAPDEHPTPASAATYRAATGTLRGDIGLTLSRARDAYEAHQKARGIRASTITAQVRVVGLFLEWSGDLEVTKVTRKLAAQWVSEKVMTMDASAKTRSDYIVRMVGFFSYLTRAGHFEALNPFGGLTQHMSGSKRATEENAGEHYRPWTDAELAKLDELPADSPLRGVALLSLWCGLRTDEAASMRVDSVNLIEKYLVVREGKNANARRYLPLHSAIVPAVTQLVTRATEAGREHLFDLKPTGADGKRAPALRAYRWMEKAFPKKDRLLTFYSLRHTALTALERAGVDLTMRQRIAGHTPSDMTSGVYSAGATLEGMRAAIEKVDFKSFRG